MVDSPSLLFRVRLTIFMFTGLPGLYIFHIISMCACRQFVQYHQDGWTHSFASSHLFLYNKIINKRYFEKQNSFNHAMNDIGYSPGKMTACHPTHYFVVKCCCQISLCRTMTVSSNNFFLIPAAIDSLPLT